MKSLTLSLLLVLISLPSFALAPVRIEAARSYDGYTNEELRRRVWQLEKAVTQLQDQVFRQVTHARARLLKCLRNVVTPAMPFIAAAATPLAATNS